MPNRRNWFKIDADGFSGLQAHREPWQLAREPISNALDEPVTEVVVTLVHGGGDARKRLAHLRVVDDSPAGFADLADAYTFFRRTPKRRRPDLRGRFNMGEKELLAIALRAKIVSTTGAVEFCDDGEVRRRREQTERGTVVEVDAPWTAGQVDDVQAMLRRFLPPDGKRLVVNGDEVAHRRPLHVVEATLQTVLEDEDGLRPTSRRTQIHVHEAPDGEGWLYELGIPVCRIDPPYLVDVQQKIPLTTERDRVLPSFLRDVLAETLNVVAVDLPADQASATWVREATRDERVAPAALTAVQRARWGERAMLWSRDDKANEEAQRRGYQIVRPAELDADERRNFMERAGLVHASTAFPTQTKAAARIPVAEWTPSMQAIAALTRRVAPRLIGREVAVQYIDDREIACAAQYSSGSVLFNLGCLAWRGAAALTAEMLSVVAHELAHDGHTDGFEHGFEYAGRLERITGAMAMLALREPELFRFGT